MTPATPDPAPRSGFDTESLVQRIAVPYEYPVHFTHNVFDPGNPLLANSVEDSESPRRALVYIDSGVTDADPDIRTAVQEYAEAHRDRLVLPAPPRVIAGGEQAKNGWRRVQDVMADIGNHHLCRQSYVIAVGGGAVLDMVGFAASLVHRGIRLIRVPSTVLAQNDAGIGVKTAMNEHGQKNFVGTFAPPHAVINDLELLQLLPQKEWVAGIAEAFKVALIRDSEFFELLCRQASALRRRDPDAMLHLVKHCARLHLDHMREGGDPFEMGSARPLDFGHWSAHKLELMSDYTLGHGQAVSIGIALDSVYAQRLGYLEKNDVTRILDGLRESGLPTWHYLLDQQTPDGTREILQGLEEFREHLGGALCVTLPRGIGERIEIHAMDLPVLEECIAELRERGTAADNQPAVEVIDLPGTDDR